MQTTSRYMYSALDGEIKGVCNFFHAVFHWLAAVFVGTSCWFRHSGLCKSPPGAVSACDRHAERYRPTGSRSAVATFAILGRMVRADRLWIVDLALRDFFWNDLGAVWATGRSLPIAGGGVPAQPWQESVVFVLIVVGSIGTAAAIAAILIQWNWVGIERA